MREVVDPNTDVERLFLRLVNAADTTALQKFVDAWLTKVVELLGVHSANESKKSQVNRLKKCMNLIKAT